jgi:hypothetical protein
MIMQQEPAMKFFKVWVVMFDGSLSKRYIEAADKLDAGYRMFEAERKAAETPLPAFREMLDTLDWANL